MPTKTNENMVKLTHGLTALDSDLRGLSCQDAPDLQCPRQRCSHTAGVGPESPISAAHDSSRNNPPSVDEEKEVRDRHVPRSNVSDKIS